MTKKESKEMQVQQQEAVAAEDTERTRQRQCFVPRADVYETETDVVVVADIPGVTNKSVEITLEKNVLIINAFRSSSIPEGYSLAYSEYEEGDYMRSFRLSNEINQEKIDAKVKNGELWLNLPKVEVAKVKKIAVKAA
ncbi:MAG: Hsp20/alpha crystallin family protein [Anaerolineales bacterium]|nr:Hsp20/alpha crystallin family protein [Anaerolineales bacterium]